MEYLRLIAVLAGLMLFGCAHPDGTNPYVQPKDKPATPLATKQIAALAFISYAGDSIDAPDYISNQIIVPCIADELSRHEILQNQYTLAWGPFVHRFKGDELDDNMMYAVWNSENKGQLVIAIRGTNSASLSDWIYEDFYISETVPWSAASSRNSAACEGSDTLEPLDSDQGSGARISKATDIGLSVLQCLGTSQTGKTTLYEFVAEQAQQGNLSSIVVAGHSLAGALAPVYALWLKDNQHKWDPNHANEDAVAISVVAIAGASPGDAAFAKLYDLELGKATNRLHNPYDVVPQGWNIATLRAMKNLYATPVSDYRPNLLERAGIELAILLAKGKKYTQIKQDQHSTWGAINTNKEGFAEQAAWQHHCGYYNALSMNTPTPMSEVNSYCVTDDYCTDNADSPMCNYRNKVKCPLVPIKPGQQAVIEQSG